MIVTNGPQTVNLHRFRVFEQELESACFLGEGFLADYRMVVGLMWRESETTNSCLCSQPYKATVPMWFPSPSLTQL